MRLRQVLVRKQGVSWRERAGARIVASTVAFGLIALGAVGVPTVAVAEVNSEITVGDIDLAKVGSSGAQLVVGDTVSVSGTWDATDADPQPGDEFVVVLPSELQLISDLPLVLAGPNGAGVVVPFGECLAVAATGVVSCTLTDEVATSPEFVHGTFQFEVRAAAATDEDTLVFGLNGIDTDVDLPGGGGIDDGVTVPEEWNKVGELNTNKWSMTWTIELPGAKLAGLNPVRVSDTLGVGHTLCSLPELQFESVRGSSVIDVSQLAQLVTPGTVDADFDVVLSEPAGGWDENRTYRIAYDTCTTSGVVDEQGTVYENSAHVDVWGETVAGVGVTQNWDFNADIKKSGTMLGGGERNGRIRWSVQLSGSYLHGKDGFTFDDSMTGEHALCVNALQDTHTYEQLGPTTQNRVEVTDQLVIVAENISADRKDFTVEVDIRAGSGFEFQQEPYIYVIVYETCVTTDGLPAEGEEFGNTVNVDGAIIETSTDTPDRKNEKEGSVSANAQVIDGVQHLPQTTLDWQITVPGEDLVGVAGPLTITDEIGVGHEVCAVGDTGDLLERLNVGAEARDQIYNGGLDPVDLRAANLVSAAQSGQAVTFTVAPPTLVQPDGSTVTGWVREYQYVFSYTTCTSSGGMDVKGTEYGNSAVIAGNTYNEVVTQTNSGSGTGQGVARGSIAVDKVLADTPGAALVPADSVFTVWVKEFAPGATEAAIEYELEVPLNGDLVSGLNSRGTGWRVEVSEPTFPVVPGVVFGNPVFRESAGVTVSADGGTAVALISPSTNIVVTLANEALLGQVSVVKAVVGGAAEQVSADEIFEVTASIDTSELGDHVAAQPDRNIELGVGNPVTLTDIPVGAIVTFVETVPENSDVFTWGAPQIESNPVEITATSVETPTLVTITNSVERTLGSFRVVKTVVGDQAQHDDVPTEVLVVATWDDAGGVTQRKEITVPTDGAPVEFGEQLLVGTEVTLSEPVLVNSSGLAWAMPVWSGTNVRTMGASGVVTVSRDARATISLRNHAATSTAGISIVKGFGGAAASAINPQTEFPVTARWVDESGETHTKQLNIHAHTPTPLGEELVAGTVVTLSEGTPPQIDGVTWGGITIGGSQVTDHGEGIATVIVSDKHDDTTLVTIVNDALVGPGLATTGGVPAPLATWVGLLALAAALTGTMLLARKRS